VTLFNDTTLEVGPDGLPEDDGIDNPGAFSIGVFDSLTGDLMVEIPDAVAWGSADLDNNGIQEIVATPTSGWGYLPGIFGYEISCSGSCSANLVWSVPNHTLRQDLDLLDNADFPEVGLELVDVGGDAVPELLAYDGNFLEVLKIGTGGVVLSAGLTLLTDGEVPHAIDAAGTHVLLVSDIGARLVDANLVDVTPILSLPGQAVGEVLAIQFDPADPRATLVIDGAIFHSNPAPSSMADADLLVLPTAAFAEDLTGDGYLDLVSYANPEESDDGSLQIALHEFDPTDPDGDGTPFGLLWTFEAVWQPDLNGFGVYNVGAIRSADLTGTGVRDIVMVARNRTTNMERLLTLDGGSGFLLDDVELDLATAAATKTVPIWVVDVDDPLGSGTPDGRDDLIIPTNYRVYVFPGGASQVSAEHTSGVYQHDGAYADLDGDGFEDLFVSLHRRIDPEVAAISISASPGDLWGQVAPLTAIGPTSDKFAVLDADLQPGLDIAYVNAAASLDILSGVDGSMVAGYPVYLSGGAITPSPDPAAAALETVTAFDCDGDGYEEALIGSADGVLYAINTSLQEPGAPSLEWSVNIGIPLSRIATADVDGDSLDEITVTSPDSTVRVLDGTGVALEINQPTNAICVAVGDLEVSGSASGVQTVDILVGGVTAAVDIPVISGTWTATVTLIATGTWLVEAFGNDAAGQAIAYDAVNVIA
jgi:hypothetical protein